MNLVDLASVLKMDSKVIIILFMCSDLASYLEQSEDTWWGPEVNKVDKSIRSFKIDVHDDVIEDLKHRLDNARLTPPLEGVQQQYGINTNLLKEIIKYWKTEYNWREREQFLNKYPQFITNIQGLDIHFIHVKPRNISSNVKILPLLMLHGWPGSPREFYETIPLLTELNNKNKHFGFVFEVIVPSLPGYGFSKGGIKPGLGPTEIGVIMKNLMFRLGFNKFYLQGGDWGAIIVAYVSSMFPNNILGSHSNMCISTTPTGLLKYFLSSLFPSWFLDQKHANKMPSLFKLLEFYILESGYFHLQATKPDTIGVGLDDSPIGLAGYILEKFSTLTNPAYRNREDGGLNLKFTYSSLLDNIMLYWINKSMTTAMRLYSEGCNKKELYGIHNMPVTVPYACAKFPHEVFYMPDNVLMTKFENLVQSTYFENGGHFAALEYPELLAEDVWNAVEKMELIHTKK